ncbi:MAG: 1-acyl-sn-glycerol-3-phosphate acyltransferase [Crocinitomicaceae bacterium]
MYSFLKILVQISLRVYFRKVQVKGKENIEDPGPYIFIANHPSAFMDPIVIATSIKPAIYFLAAGEYMGKGFKYWFMNKFLHMIPVYRPETMPGETFKNDKVFDKCIEHLQSGRTILVFPEGASNTEKKISPLKTGVARIVRATEIASNMEAHVKIVPIGLNYSNPHKFRSDLLVNIGEPILAGNYFSLHQESEHEEVRALTDHMEEQLINTVLHVENHELEELLDKINQTYSRDLKKKLGVGFENLNREFELNKLTISAINYFKEHDPEEYNSMTSAIDEYLTELEKYGASDKEVRKVDEKTSFTERLFLIWGSIPFLIGFIGNILPYELAILIQKKLDVKGSFRGSIILAVGMFIFLVWYVGIMVTVWLTTPLSYFSLLIPPVLYFMGMHALVFSTAYQYLTHRKRVRQFLAKNPDVSNGLLEMRQLLMNRFERLRAKFDNRAEVNAS